MCRSHCCRAFVLVTQLGKPSADDPLIQSILAQPGSEPLAYCAPNFDSLLCLNMLGGGSRETAWTGSLNMIMSFVSDCADPLAHQGRDRDCHLEAGGELR